MPAPSLITDLSQTAGSNQPVGSVDTPSTLDDVQRAHASFIAMLRDGVGFTNPATLASAGTCSIGGVSSLSVEITGTTTITSFGTTYNGPRFLRFQGALTLTHSSSLNLPGAANITTAAGDTCIAIPNQALSGWNVYSYQRASLAVTSALLTQSTARMLGRTTASTGAIEELTAAQVSAFAAAASDTAQGVVELATTAEVKTGTDTARPPSVSSLRGGMIVNYGRIASTSGTSINFTSIPSWVTRITMQLDGVSTNGTNGLGIQLGDSGGLESSGYSAGCWGGATGNTVSGATSSSQFPLIATGFAAGSSYSGVVVFTLMDAATFTWACSGNIYASTGSATGYSCAGTKALSAALDRISLVSSDTFDAGYVNILYE